MKSGRQTKSKLQTYEQFVEAYKKYKKEKNEAPIAEPTKKRCSEMDELNNLRRSL